MHATRFLFLKEGLQSVLRIGSAHNKGGPPNINIQCPSFAFFELFLNWNSGLHSFISIANQKSVRYSFSKSYFTNTEFHNVNKAFVYITDCNPSLSINSKTLICSCMYSGPGFHITLTVGKLYCRWSFMSKIFCLSEIIFFFSDYQA